jgi:Mg/Co/Ni transporter MgtE
MKFKLELDVDDDLVKQLKKIAKNKNTTWNQLLESEMDSTILYYLSEDLNNWIIESIIPRLEGD